MLSEPAKKYLSGLPAKHQQIYESFTAGEKGDFNRFTETILSDYAKEYSNAVEKDIIPPDIELEEYRQYSEIAKTEARKALDSMFSRERALERQREKEFFQKKIQAHAKVESYNLTPTDLNELKKLEKVTGKSILEKYSVKHGKEQGNKTKNPAKVLESYAISRNEGNDKNRDLEYDV